MEKQVCTIYFLQEPVGVNPGPQIWEKAQTQPGVDSPHPPKKT